MILILLEWPIPCHPKHNLFESHVLPFQYRYQYKPHDLRENQSMARMMMMIMTVDLFVVVEWMKREMSIVWEDEKVARFE